MTGSILLSILTGYFIQDGKSPTGSKFFQRHITDSRQGQCLSLAITWSASSLISQYLFIILSQLSGDIRVCNYCQKIVQAYLNDDLENSIEALNGDIKAVEQGYRYDFNSSSGSLNSKSGKHMDDSGYRMKVFKNCLQLLKT